MASPFTIFRKHQKMLIATLGLLAMIAFVFLSGPVLDTILSGSHTNPVVVSTKKYGSLNEADLHSLVVNRNVILNFFFEALGRRIPIEYIEDSLGPATEDSAVTTWVLSNRAKQTGLVVSDEAIAEFIRKFTVRFTGEQVSADTMRKALKSQGVTERQLFEALRSELAAYYYQRLFFYSLMPTPPGQRWDYYERLNRRATVQVTAVPVAKYLDEVQDPDESTLREFFEQAKDKDHDPSSPDPGFRRPHRIALQYFKAEIDKFLKPAEISEEQIKQYYEQNKDPHYLRSRLPEIEKKPEASGQKPEPGTKPEPKADTKPESKPEQKPESKPEQKPESKPSAEKPAPEAKDRPKDSKVPPAEPKNTTAAPSAPTPAKKDDGVGKPAENPVPKKTSSARPASPFRLTAFLEGGTPEKPAAKPVEPPAKPAEKPAEPAAKPAEKPAEPAAKPPAKPAEKPAEPAAKPGAKPAEPSAKPKPGEPAAKPTESGPLSKYVPLDDVKDQIRDDLARARAELKVEEILGRLRDRMEQYNRQWIRASVDPTKQPEKLPMAELAQQNGLTLRETGLISDLEAVQLDIGRSRVVERESFLRYAFQPRPEYSPAISKDAAGNSYLFWKTEDSKEGVPSWDFSEAEEAEREAEKLEGQGKVEAAREAAEKAVKSRRETTEIHRRVLHEWKMTQARSLARDAAAILATKSAKSGKPLKEALASETGVSVIEAGPFSWLTHGSVSPRMFNAPPPRLSQVPGVNMAGEDFMETVFSMEPGEVKVAMNQPKTAAYVIQVTAFEPPPAVLWQLFLVDDYEKYASVAVRDQQRLVGAWMDEIKTSIGLKWERKAVVVRRER
jgi:hypothetical protein